MAFDPITAGAVGIAVKSLEKPLASLLSFATGPIKKLAGNWVVAGKRDAIVQGIEEVELVRTISSVERVPLSSFYYPCRLVNRHASKQLPQPTIGCLADVAVEGNIVIYGTVGQGKSILMRYLCLQELKIGQKIPIFVELRSIEIGSNLRSTILQTLASVGFGELSHDDFHFLLKSGSFVFFLDGFDEVKRELALTVQAELADFTKQFPTTRWVISSRPGSLSGHLAGVRKLRPVYIAPLSDDDYEPFLTALNVAPEARRRLIDAIASSPVDIKGVLKTPLMLTLLNMTFGTSTHVPSTLHEFYESMFLFLVYRHDETKPGFVRQKATALSNAELQDAFEHFAFLSKEYGTALTDEEFSSCSRNAMKLCGREFTAEGFRTDLTETVCLMMRDGLKTAFIHRSIQEFFSAFFVKHLGAELQVQRIYERMNGTAFVNWQQEIRFLEQIDKYRYMQYFRLPAIREFLKDTGYARDKTVCVTKKNFLKFLSKEPIYVVPRRDLGGNRSSSWIVGITRDNSFDVITHELAKLFECDGFADDLDFMREMSRQPLGRISRLDARFRSASNESEAALLKFRDFTRRIDREQQRLEKSLKERENHFRDLLLPTAT